MRIRVHYYDHSSQDYDIVGFALDETNKHLDMIVKHPHNVHKLEKLNWPAVTRIENLEAVRS